MDPQLGFGGPEDWYPETDDAVKATEGFIAVVRKLLDGGDPVDCIDVWAGAEIGRVARQEVDLSAVSNREFRFFENYHFVFRKGAAGST